MPLPYKIALSVIVVLVAGLVAWSEFSGPASSAYLGWIVIAIAGVMVFGLWVFPEAGGGKRKTPS